MNHVDIETDVWLRNQRWDAYRLQEWLEGFLKEEGMDGVRVLKMYVTTPQSGKGKYTVVVKGAAPDGTPVVCFGGGATYKDALAEIKARSEAQNIRWREDSPPPWVQG
jgi:hypothetical protein